jgi:MurNAc alpha-1-phosphate uridylyltransferase
VSQEPVVMAGGSAGCHPKKAMVLAAGLGLRLRPITEKLPKPLIEIAGRSLLDRALDRLDDAGIELAVVNVHYLGEMIEEHLKDRATPKTIVSREESLLETGGGVLRALPILGDAPFYVVNGDALWLNGHEDTLTRMARMWDDSVMDGLLLLHSTVEAYGYDGVGDFLLDPVGRLTRRPESEVSPYLFTGIQLLHPRLFQGVPEGFFSLNLMYDRAIAEGRLFGIVHDGEWFHVGTPEHLETAQTYMTVNYPGVKRR